MYIIITIIIVIWIQDKGMRRLWWHRFAPGWETSGWEWSMGEGGFFLIIDIIILVVIIVIIIIVIIIVIMIIKIISDKLSPLYFRGKDVTG